MELTKEQIQRVEHYLNVKNIVYIDLRVEVLDHIVSEIETEIENLDFETAFYNVTDKWNKHLKQTSSLYFGIAYSLPRIVLDKAKKLFKKFFILTVLIYFTILFFIKNTNIFILESVKNEFNLFFQIITVLTFLIFSFLLILKLREKKKTTYSFILKTQSWNLFLGFIILFDFNFLNKKGAFDAVQLAILCVFIFSTFIYFHFYKKHKEAVKKYKIS